MFSSTEENERVLRDMEEQTKWILNACVDVFKDNYDMDELKKQLLKEKEDLKVYLEKVKQAKKIKDKEARKMELERLKKEESVKLTKIYNNQFRDLVRKYKYIETPYCTTTDGKDAIIAEFKYDDDTDKFPLPNWWNYNHNRIPRGVIKSFVGALNSSISNYRNSERDFTVNYRTSKSKNSNIYFEDKGYPKIIDTIPSKYCYTKVIDGKKKRMSISLSEMRKITEINSMNIVYEKDTGKRYLYLSVPIGFYLPNDKRTENQITFDRKGDTILLLSILTFAHKE